MRPAPIATIHRLGSGVLHIGSNGGRPIYDRPGLKSLLHRADGTRTVDELVELCRADVPDAPALCRELLDQAILVAKRPPRQSLRVAIDPGRGTTWPASVLSAALGPLVTLTDRRADVRIVLCDGEPNRRALDPLMWERTAHLTVVFDGERVVLGPWTVPGQTPCLGCHDIERARYDPTWDTLRSQFGGTRTAEVGHHPMTALNAVARTVEEVLDASRGLRPATVGRRLVIGAEPSNGAGPPIGLEPACPCSFLPT